MATVFVGTYTEPLDHVNGRGAGIYIYSFNEGRLRPEGAVRGLPSPSYLVIDAARYRLYAVSEALEFNGLAQGAVQAWAWDSEPVALESLGHVGTRGGAPCYISILHNHLLIANYVGGSVIAVSLTENGGLGQVTGYVQHTGTGPNPARQEAPHPHAIVPDPTEEYCLVPDLGTDRVYIYRMDRSKADLRSAGEAVKIHAGAGPRHLVFNPAGTGMYLMNELDSTISFLEWENGRATLLHTLDALPEGYTGIRSGADIHVHPSGQFLYVSLRGLASIVCFQIDAGTGRLVQPAWFPTHGTTPRNFTLDSAGEHLIVANQDSDTLVVYRIDNKSGHLVGPRQVLNVPSPACVKIVS